jgi:signal transduction histidine kinase
MKTFDELIADKNRIIQILINLLDNSIKFTKTGTIKLNAFKLVKIENTSKYYFVYPIPEAAFK